MMHNQRCFVHAATLTANKRLALMLKITFFTEFSHEINKYKVTLNFELMVKNAEFLHYIYTN